jgi:hypothetical protein
LSFISDADRNLMRHATALVEKAKRHPWMLAVAAVYFVVYGWLLLLLSILALLPIVLFIERPMEQWRNRRL